MNRTEYKKMEKFEQTYWWHRGRIFMLGKLIRRYLPSTGAGAKLLEIGSGTGETLKFLADYGHVTGIDISKDAVNFCRAKGLKNVIHGDISSLDMREHRNTYHAIFALDVLEHIQDDVDTMKKVSETLIDGGYFFVTVPAHKFLWSEHDEALHHKRRYHSLELKQKLEDEGFEVVKKSYFVFFAFLPIVLFRMWNNIFGKSAYPKTSYVVLPKKLNDFGTNLLKLETFIIQLIGLPIGTTMVAVARKPTNNEKSF